MKYSICACLFLITVLTSHGQKNYGVKVGINYATQVLSGEPANSYTYSDAIIGFHAGWSGSFNITPSIMFRPEVLLSKKGQLEKISPPYSKGYSFRDQIYYLESPLMLSLDLGKSRERGFFLTTGVYLACGLSGRSVYIDNATHVEENRSVRFQSGVTTPGDELVVKRFDSGLIAGVGYRVSRLAFDLTHNIGFTNIHTKTSTDDKMITRNLVLKFGVCYLFGSD